MGIPQPPLAITLAVNFPVAVAAAEFLAAIIITAAAFSGRQFDDGMRAKTSALGLRVRLVSDRATLAGPDDFRVPDLGGTPWSPLVMCLPIQVLTYLTVQRRGIDLSLPMNGAVYGKRFDEMHVEWTKRSALDPDGTLY